MVSPIPIDLGKHSLHLHAQDAAGRMGGRKKLTRRPLLSQLADVPACTDLNGSMVWQGIWYKKQRTTLRLL